MSLTCVIELNNGKYFVGATDNPWTFLSNCQKSTVPFLKTNRPKRIVFVDECDVGAKFGQLCMKYGVNNCKYEGMETVEKVERKGLENFGKKWTPEEKQGVLADYRNKMNVRDIAAKYKRTVGAVVSELHSNIPKSTEVYPAPTKKGDKWTEEENKALVELYNAKTDMKNILTQLCRSKSAVECHLIHLGVLIL